MDDLGGYPPFEKKNLHMCFASIVHKLICRFWNHVLICSFSFGKCSSISKYAPYINSFQITLGFLDNL